MLLLARRLHHHTVLLNILPFSDSIGSYAGVLIILIFTIVGINGFEFGNKGSSKEEINRILGFQLYRFIAFFIEFIVPIALTLLIFTKVFPVLNDGFGILLASGFYGGHGTATAVGGTLANLGWSDAPDLAMTFATMGILIGVFGGLALIKIGTKRGDSGYIKDFKYITGDIKTGLVKKENRESIGEETISPVSLDTLCFHLSIILAISGISYMLNGWIAENVMSGIPDFTIAYVLALIFFLAFRKTPVYNYVDTGISGKISGTSTDYLVFFGISSIKLAVVAKYALPLILMGIIGIVMLILIVYPLGKIFNKDSWFERAMFIYGYSAGVFAIGFVLLRIVDPENKSKTVEDVAMTPLTSFVEIIMWSVIPVMLMNGQGWLIVGVLSIFVIASFIIGKLTGSWWLGIDDSQRKTLGTKIEQSN